MRNIEKQAVELQASTANGVNVTPFDA